MATATAVPTNGSTTKFSPGFEPEEIALQSITGKTVNSNFGGDQVLFTLVGGKRWYAPVYVARKIERMRIQPGELFTVCKTALIREGQRVTEIDITSVVEVPKEPAATQTRATAGVNRGTAESSRRAGNSDNNPNPTPNRPPAPSPAVAAPAASAANAPMNGHGETSAVRMARCYRDAIDISAVGLAYAKEVGLAISPCFEDIRALAAVMFISETQGRRS